MANNKFGWKPTNNTINDNNVIDVHINSGEFTISDQRGKIVVLPSSGDCGKIEKYGYEFELERFTSSIPEDAQIPSIKRSKENSDCEKDYLVTWFNNGSNMQYPSVVRDSHIFTVKGVDDGRFEAIRYPKAQGQCKFTTTAMNFRTANYTDCGYPKIKTKPFCTCEGQEPKYKQGATYNGHKIYYVPNDNTIPDGAFSGITDLVEVYFPFKTTDRPVGNPYHCHATQTIGVGAFKGCNNLSAVTFSSVEEIGANAFSGCTNLKDIDWGNCCTGPSMSAITSNAFDGCSSLKQLVFPFSLRTIGENAFKNCTSLEKVTFRNRSTSADTNSFIGCTRLSNVYFNYNEPPEWSFSSAFGSDNNISVVIPRTAQSTKSRWESWCGKTVILGDIDNGCDEN